MSEKPEVATAEDHSASNALAAEALQDESSRALISHFESQSDEWRQEKSKALLRKVDLRLLPFLIVMYLLNFLDRSNLAQARLGSLEEDLGMTGSDFNLATSIFFVGYLLMQLPSNLLITRLRPSIYLSSAMVLWGAVSACNGATKKFTDLVVVRFFLGFVEAPFFPGAIFLMSSWYTRAEMTRRISWFYSGNALANMFGGLLGAAILGNLDGNLGLAGWRWLFIIEGVITIGVAIVAGFVLPDYPHTTRWLSEEERTYAAWRLLEDISEVDQQHGASVWAGLKMALRDYRLYVFVLFQHTSLLSQTFQYFFPTIVNTLGESLGLSNIQILWITAPIWFATFLVSVCVTWTSAKTKDRSIHIMCLMCVSAVGNAVATGTTKTGPRFFAMFLMPMGAVSAYQILVSWVTNSFPRPLVKRSSAIAICNMIGNTASIYGSYMYPSKDEPQFVPGGSANAVICILVALIAFALRLIHIKENKKLERAEAEGHQGEGVASGDTDPELRAVGFRYIL